MNSTELSSSRQIVACRSLGYRAGDLTVFGDSCRYLIAVIFSGAIPVQCCNKITISDEEKFRAQLVTLLSIGSRVGRLVTFGKIVATFCWCSDCVHICAYFVVNVLIV